MPAAVPLEMRSSTISASLRTLRELRRRYRYLYEAPIVRRPDGSTAFHEARLYDRGGLPVLSLKGDTFEMAYQHGKLLAESVREGVLRQLSRTIPNQLENSVSRSKLLNRILLGLVDFMGRSLRRHIPEEYLHECFALSEGSGLAMHHISNALLAMEAVYILAKYAVKSNGIDWSPMAFSGCSSFCAWNEFSRDGELVIGRNLDYPLNGYFDAHPLVAYYEPKDGQKYCTLGTAGLHTPSLTTFNESGIYLAGHLIPTNETSFRGMPIYFLAADVIKRARSFDEAVEIFRSQHTTFGWSFVLVSFREKRAAVVEMTAKRLEVRESTDGALFQSNHFCQMKDANLVVNRSVDEDTLGRYRRLEERVRQARGSVDIRLAPSILGDAFDPFAQRDRGLGATVAVCITVGSAVFDPARNRFFVATGRAPVVFNDFVEFPMFERFDRETFAAEAFERVPGADLPRREPAMVEAIQSYIKAKTAYEYNSDLETAFREMQEVMRLDPGNGAYRFVYAVIALKREDRETAKAAFAEVLAMDHTRQLRHLAAYYRGRILAAEGKRIEALADFDLVLGDDKADEKLRRAVKRARQIVFIFGRYGFKADRLPLMMQFSDMVSY